MITQYADEVIYASNTEFSKPQPEWGDTMGLGENGVNKNTDTNHHDWDHDVRRIRCYSALSTVVWTLLFALFISYNFFEERKSFDRLAYNDALTNFNKDQAIRLWATSHGGVYVPITERTPPNLNLAHIPERDITTPSGKKLTLMNPAYIIRQFMNEYGDIYGTRGRITSLKPLWPGNAPDAWERKSLLAFEAGAQEVMEETEIDGKPYLRLMRPMLTKQECLKCHAEQGYKIGDVRGGVGVMVPLTPYREQANKMNAIEVVWHAGIWAVGLAFILFVSNRALKQTRERTVLFDRVKSAYQAAEDANLAKSQFLATMSHELRTPLHTILGFSEMMLNSPSKNSPDAGRSVEYIEDIHTSARHLMDVINDVLDLAKMDAGKLKLDLIRISTKENIQGIVRLMMERAHKKRIALHTIISPDTPDMMADERAVKQIMFNLISNAIKFTPENGTITVTVKLVDNSVSIAVADTGVGIPFDQIDRVLKPFEQVDNRYSRSEGGTGLGLSVVQGLAKLHGGRLTIESTVGQGSIFTVYLPSASISPYS